MSSLVLTGDTSGQVTLAAPAVAGSNTLTLQAATATMSVNTLATAVASTSGTSIDFTGLPSWVKKITVMFNGVSTNGTSIIQLQLGTGSTSYTTSGYVGGAWFSNTTNLTVTTGLPISGSNAAARIYSGLMTLTSMGSNMWAGAGTFFDTSQNASMGASAVTLGAALTAVRITTVNGTDTFDAGTINILYEG